MGNLAYLLRFFSVVAPVSSMMIATFGVITVTAAAAVVDDPARASGALVPVLLLQLFAASSGFAAPARRGHYDLLLTRGGNRVLIAMAHWAASVTPGIASWLTLAGIELVTSAGTRSSLFASGTWAAVAMVSTLPWALTVRLPRFSGGIGWLLVLVTMASTFSSATIVTGWTVESTRIDALLWPAWSFLIYPVGAIGQRLGGAQLIAATPALGLAVCSMAAACWWVARSEVPLEAAQ